MTWEDVWFADLIAPRALAAAMQEHTPHQLEHAAEAATQTPFEILDALRCGDSPPARLARVLSRQHLHDLVLEQAELARLAAKAHGAEVTRTSDHALGRRTGTVSPFLVVRGDPAKFRGAAIAIVGTRTLVGRQVQVARTFIEGLADANPASSFVSGGAHGVDTLAHDVALERGIPIAIVVAGGIAHAGPASNRAAFEQVVAFGGWILSDRPPHKRPVPAEFLKRNRIIASLANVTVVVRAPARSGALSTARAASALGRPVFAVPGDPDDPSAVGCHELIRGGATLAARPEHVRSSALSGQLSLVTSTSIPRSSATGNATGSRAGQAVTRRSAQKDRPQGRSQNDQQTQPCGDRVVRKNTPTDDPVFEAVAPLLRSGPQHIDMLARIAAQSPATMSASLLDWELEGVVRALPGNRFQLTP